MHGNENNYDKQETKVRENEFVSKTHKKKEEIKIFCIYKYQKYFYPTFNSDWPRF